MLIIEPGTIDVFAADANDDESPIAGTIFQEIARVRAATARKCALE